MLKSKATQPIGKRLQQLRKEKKLTLKNLGNETGLIPQFISQIEKGDVIPPVSVILQLSRALGIDSGILLNVERGKLAKQSDEDYLKRTKDYSYKVLTPEARDKHLKAFRIFIDPQSEHKGVSYQHMGEEFIYVLEGKIEVMVGENKNILSSGECLHFNSSIVHKLQNISKNQAELLVILYTP